MNRPRVLLLLAGLATVLAACGTSAATTNTVSTADDATEASDAGALSVVVTTTVWGDIVSNVTGNAATVEVLFPA